MALDRGEWRAVLNSFGFRGRCNISRLAGRLLVYREGFYIIKIILFHGSKMWQLTEQLRSKIGLLEFCYGRFC
jgi:hypothetical protein